MVNNKGTSNLDSAHYSPQNLGHEAVDTTEKDVYLAKDEGIKENNPLRSSYDDYTTFHPSRSELNHSFRYRTLHIRWQILIRVMHRIALVWDYRNIFRLASRNFLVTHRERASTNSQFFRIFLFK